MPAKFYPAVFLAFSILAACNSGPAQKSQETAGYTVIYIIHGDNDYLYHNKQGESFYADEVTFSKAKEAAAEYPEGEAFIFYIGRDENSLLFFPKDDGRYYYYANGKKAAEGSFDVSNLKEGYRLMSGIVNEFSSPASEKQYLLYYGHEIPYREEEYSLSADKGNFSVKDFAEGISGFGKNEIIALSTCRGGEVNTLRAIAPFTDFAVASPVDLHLSYLDVVIDTRIETTPKEAADNYAESSFKRLTGETATETVIAIYDMEKISPRLEKIHELDKIQDFSELKISAPEFTEGIKVFYNPPLFGKSKNNTGHSGLSSYK